MKSHGAIKPSYSTIVAAGATGSLPHAVPGEYRLRRGDMITMDFGARYGNYCADMTRTVALGEPSAEMKKVYGIVLDAQKMAQDAVAAGRSCRRAYWGKVSRMDSSVVSWATPLLRSMFTLPT